MMDNCFENICDCNCLQANLEIDRILQQEVNFGITFRELTHSNIGWFSDKSLSSDHLLNDWRTNSITGVYILWHKNDYCDKHGLFHMKALYVGKGNIFERIIRHWKAKDFSEEMLVYFTYVEIENRKAKYLEQLILDLFNVPFNQSENPGSEKLCAYFTQNEVD